MSRLVYSLLGGLCLVSLLGGCKQLLPKMWSFHDTRRHAEKVDSDLSDLYTEINDIVFGVKPEEAPGGWRIYR